MNDAVTALLEREAIRELAIRYCHCMWNRDLSVIDLYTPDGRFNDHQGRDGIHRFYADAFGNPAREARPYAANHAIELRDARNASGVCHADVRLKLDGFHVLYVGAWHDEYRKLDDGWRIHVRDFRLAYKVNLGAID